MIVVNEGIKIDYEGVKGKGQWFKRCKSLMRVNYEGVNIRGKLLMKIYTLYESWFWRCKDWGSVVYKDIKV